MKNSVMELSEFHGCNNLPPAYAAVEELSRLLGEAGVKRREVEVRYAKTASPEHARESLGEIQVETYQLAEALHSTFLETLGEEINAGRFEIFEAANLIPFLRTPEEIEYAKVTFTLDHVFSALLPSLEAEGGTVGVVALASKCQDSLSSGQMDELWAAYRRALRQEHLWLAAAGLPSEPSPPDGFKDGNLDVPWSALLQASIFFENPNASEKMLSEASFLTFGNWPTVLLQKTAHPNLLKFDALAAAVQGLNPVFFEREVKALNIDPKVVDTLICSWRGNFASFLTAAQTLSADPAS